MGNKPELQTKKILSAFIIVFFSCNAFSAGTISVDATLNNLEGTIRQANNLNDDLSISGGVLLPQTLTMRCANGMMAGSQTKCNPDLWVDIKSTLKGNDYKTLSIGDDIFTVIYNTESRNARCTSHNSLTLDCVWEGDINITLNLSPKSGGEAKKQNVKLYMQPTNSSSAQTQNINGNIIFNSERYEESYDSYNETVHSTINLDTEISIINSNFGTGITTVPGILNFFGEVQMTASVNPENLAASFDEKSLIISSRKEFIGEARKEPIINIYLQNRNMPCNAGDPNSICTQIRDNATVSMVCGDHNLSIESIMCDNDNSKCSPSQIAEIIGTWGKVNSDTDCAITILLPYE